VSHRTESAPPPLRAENCRVVTSYSSLGVRRVLNACGIYTDLGGSSLSPAVWAAAGEANATWVAMDELLDASGARIAGLVGAPAARVVPGASAGIALAVGACVARGEGAVMEALPAVPSSVLLQRAHAGSYVYSRCAALAGAQVRVVDDLAVALSARPAAVLHPAHLDSAGVPVEAVAELASVAGVPVIVDAAFQCFPVSAFERWSAAGDAAVFSAKYFGGPNAGGFVAGSSALVGHLAALDFVGYESGPWRVFGRAFKLDRAGVVAVVAALEEWLACDHAARLAGHGARAARLRELVGGELRQFTLDERVLAEEPFNAVRVPGLGAAAEALEGGDPSVRAVVDGDALVLNVEALSSPEIDELAAILSARCPN
jgi:D-glucosaminate-6-phosphate ammonia-lyase